MVLLKEITEGIWGKNKRIDCVLYGRVGMVEGE